MADYQIANAIGSISNALGRLAVAEQTKADALAKIADQYERQLDLQEFKS